MCMYIYYIYCIQSWSFSPKLECYFIDTLRIPSMFLFMKMKKTESSFKYIFEARKNIFKISNNICCIAKIDVLVQYLQRETHGLSRLPQTRVYILKEVFVYGTIYPKVPAQKWRQLSLQPFCVQCMSYCNVYCIMFANIFFNTVTAIKRLKKRIVNCH